MRQSAVRFKRQAISGLVSRLTCPAVRTTRDGMLQHNIARASANPAGNAHAAHAAVVGGHLFCCGAPVVLMLFAAGAGASIGLSAVQRFFQETHTYLHTHEILDTCAVGDFCPGRRLARMAGASRTAAVAPFRCFAAMLRAQRQCDLHASRRTRARLFCRGSDPVRGIRSRIFDRGRASGVNEELEAVAFLVELQSRGFYSAGCRTAD